MSKHVARRDSELSDDGRPDMAAIGAKVHDAKDGEESAGILEESIGAGAALDMVDDA